jgi:hypothetical protein
MIIVWTVIAIAFGVSWRIGIIAAGLLFLVGLSRGFQSYFVSRKHRRRTGPG